MRTTSRQPEVPAHEPVIQGWIGWVGWAGGQAQASLHTDCLQTARPGRSGRPTTRDAQWTRLSRRPIRATDRASLSGAEQLVPRKASRWPLAFASPALAASFIVPRDLASMTWHGRDEDLERGEGRGPGVEGEGQSREPGDADL